MDIYLSTAGFVVESTAHTLSTKGYEAFSLVTHPKRRGLRIIVFDFASSFILFRSSSIFILLLLISVRRYHHHLLLLLLFKVTFLFPDFLFLSGRTSRRNPTDIRLKYFCFRERKG